MVQLVRHPQTKGRETDRLDLNHRATSRLYPFLKLRTHPPGRRPWFGLLWQLAASCILDGSRWRRPPDWPFLRESTYLVCAEMPDYREPGFGMNSAAFILCLGSAAKMA